MYLRQSRDRDGNELAVSRQREDCQKLCAARGWTDVVEYVDNNVSASKRSISRPAYRQMLADVEAGHISAIVAWDLDRLYRQPRELEDLIDLADEHDLALATATGDVDLATDNGRLFARMKGAVAKAEGERKAARWKRSNEQGAAAGKWVPTYRPFGYTWKGEPLEPEATLVRQAYRDVLEGKSLRRIATEWNEQGFTTPGRNGREGVRWGNRQIRKLLENPKYMALRVLNTTERQEDGKRVAVRKEYPGEWTPLVDRDTFEGVAAILNDESRAICTTFEVAHLGANCYICGRCGSTMKTHYDGRGVRVYTCRKQPHLTRRGSTLDDFVANAVLERLSAPDAALMLKKPEKTDVAKLHRDREAFVSRRDELSQLLRDGLLDARAVRRDAEDLTKRIADVDRQLADAARVSPAAALVASGGDIRSRWEQLTPSLQRQIVDEVAVVTVLPCPRGLRGFDPDYVDLKFRADT
ncbi:recombinase family protein [Mycolicibacterium porcinum]|uniref:recombinase family protein n=1 Tax=Mycolicibacterium porcinum TaxID=39693 RepID=UPI000AEC3C26|nr:recombinase family protein [Mycolicibacterium porcinum]